MQGIAGNVMQGNAVNVMQGNAGNAGNVMQAKRLLCTMAFSSLTKAWKKCLRFIFLKGK